jgi:hypothetical protein
MQHPLHIDTQTGPVLQQLRIPHTPKSEDRRGSGIQWHLGIARCLSRLPALIDGIGVADRQSEFADFAALDLNGIRGKALADFARVKHPTVSFFLDQCCLQTHVPRQQAESYNDPLPGSVLSA